MPPLISRGFKGRRGDGPADRVPPGQYVTPDFPLLSAGPTPHNGWRGVKWLPQGLGGDRIVELIVMSGVGLFQRRVRGLYRLWRDRG
jgi:hypothetical protein